MVIAYLLTRSQRLIFRLLRVLFPNPLCGAIMGRFRR